MADMFDLQFSDGGSVPIEDDDAEPHSLDAFPFPEPDPEPIINDANVKRCKTCGDPVEYSGRGKPPQYCAKHKPARSSSGTRVSGGTSKDAAVAAEVLTQINSMIALALMIAPEPFKMEKTGTALSDSADKFKPQAEQALQSSPALARAIARAGGVSGGAGLIIAYGMLAATLAPIAVAEWKGKNAPRT